MADPSVRVDYHRLHDVLTSAAVTAAGLRRLAERNEVGLLAAMPGSATAAVTGPHQVAGRLDTLAAGLSEWAEAATAGARRLAGDDAAAGDRIAGS